jgi:hypothetical protein
MGRTRSYLCPHVIRVRSGHGRSNKHDMRWMQLLGLNVGIEAGAQCGSVRKSKQKQNDSSVCVYLGPVRATNNGRGSRAPTRRSKIWLTCRCWTIRARLHTNEAAADQRPAGIAEWTWFGSKMSLSFSSAATRTSGQLQNGTRVCVLGQVPSATERPAVAAAAFFKFWPRPTP